MEVDVINTNERKQRFRFNMKSSDNISLSYGFLYFQRIATGEKAEIRLKDNAHCCLTVWHGQTMIYLDSDDFDAFRAALNETSAEATDYTFGDEDE